MTSFLTDIENTLVNDRIHSVLSLPLTAPVPHGHADPGADLHVRIPKALSDELDAIAGAYPTSRTNLVRVFLAMAVKEWRVQQRLAAEAAKPVVERAKARKLGAGRQK